MHMARLRCALDLGKSVAASIKARSTQKIVSLSVCIIAAKINILQPAALREPVRQPVALQQIAKRAASRHALVAHRWKNEYFAPMARNVQLLRDFLGSMCARLRDDRKEQKHRENGDMYDALKHRGPAGA